MHKNFHIRKIIINKLKKNKLMHKQIASIAIIEYTTEICIYTEKEYILYSPVLDDIECRIMKNIFAVHNVSLCLIPSNINEFFYQHITEYDIKYEKYQTKKKECEFEALIALKKYVYSFNNKELKVSYKNINDVMLLNNKTLTNLKIIKKPKCLFKEINYTVTMAGKNMLRMWIQHPLLKVEDIETRHTLQNKLENKEGYIRKKLLNCRNSLIKRNRKNGRLMEMENINGHRKVRQMWKMLKAGVEISEAVKKRIELKNKQKYISVKQMIEKYTDEKGICENADEKLNVFKKRQRELNKYLNEVAMEICKMEKKRVKVVYFPQFGYLIESSGDFEKEIFRIKSKGYFKTAEMEMMDERLGDIEIDIENREIHLMNKIEKIIKETDFSYFNEFIGTIDAICSMIKYRKIYKCNKPIFEEKEMIRVGASTGKNSCNRKKYVSDSSEKKYTASNSSETNFSLNNHSKSNYSELNDNSKSNYNELNYNSLSHSRSSCKTKCGSKKNGKKKCSVKNNGKTKCGVKNKGKVNSYKLNNDKSNSSEAHSSILNYNRNLSPTDNSSSNDITQISRHVITEKLAFHNKYLLQLSNELIGKRMIYTKNTSKGTAVGQLCILAQMGFYLSFKKVEICLFESIVVKETNKKMLKKKESSFIEDIVGLENSINKCTSNSLCIFKKIGRGTNYYDGLGLFMATAEYIQGKMLILTTDFDLMKIRRIEHESIKKWFTDFKIKDRM